MNARPADCLPADGVALAAAELAQLLLTAYPPQAVLDRVALLSLNVVPGATSAGCSFAAPDVPADLSPAFTPGVVNLPLVAGEGEQRRAVAILTVQGAPTAFDGFQPESVAPFLSQAGVTLHNAQAFHAATELNAQLREALSSRAVIEQAKGAIMARRHVSAVSAFELLRRSSTRRNVKLRDVAQEVVDSTQPR